MKELVKINNCELKRRLFNGEMVLTLNEIDMVHGRPEGTARHAFNRHKERFQEGVDYFKVSHEEWQRRFGIELNPRNLSGHIIHAQDHGGYRGDRVLTTLRGYCKLVKPFNDDQSWRVQQMLINNYFKVGGGRAIPASQPVNALPSVRVVACEDTLVRLFRWPGLEGECITGLDFTRALGYANSNSISRPPYNASMYEGHERILKGEELKRFRSLASTVGYHISPNQSLRLVDMVYARRVALFGRSKRSLRFLQWCEELQTGLIANMVPGRGGLPVQGSFQLHA